ncbi:unnamed protein product [Vicia faba]|uniref:Uncharacterized protein n=1 Tax=Vicia faba TaxID=3906 RepID=A0AAV1AMP1_VICFA|nr:unnamed protein product [Vicia faba]
MPLHSTITPDFSQALQFKPLVSLMGYYCYKHKYKRNHGTCSDHTSDVVMMLAVALMLLGIPWLFSRSGPVVVVEENKNWSLTPILVLLILLFLSFIGRPRRTNMKSICCRSILDSRIMSHFSNIGFKNYVPLQQ